MNASRYAVLILAAGLSSRMGSLKPLLSLGDQTILERTLNAYLHNKLDIHLIVGYKQAEIKKHLCKQNISIIDNPDYQTGMFSSVLVGVRSLRDKYDGFFVSPVDLPLIRNYTIKLLLDAFINHPNHIIYPMFKGQRGHPTGIPVSLISEILHWKGGGGLKAILEANNNMAYEVEVPDRYILKDIDTLDDFREIKAQLKDCEVPNAEECEVILKNLCEVPAQVRLHGYKVAEVANSIAQALIIQGQPVNVPLVEAGSLLHDIAKGHSDHDRVGSQMLIEMGFYQTAKIVSSHMEISDHAADSLEAKIVYLADKYVQEDRIITLEQRFQKPYQLFAVTPEVEANIKRRQLEVLFIKSGIEKLLGVPLEEIIHKVAVMQTNEED